MRNVFLVYMPPSNSTAMLHYRETIERPVPQGRILPHLNKNEKKALKSLFAESDVAVWGSQDGEGNRRMFDKMSEGDDLLIVEGQTVKFMGKVGVKTVNVDLSRELWKGGGADAKPWSLIYVIGNPKPLGIPFSAFCSLFDYEAGYQLRGLTTVSTAKLEAFHERYDDLYSILSKIKNGEAVLPKPDVLAPAVDGGLVPVPVEDIDEILNSDLVSDHVRMQWTLAKLGRQSGAKVWIPVSDQSKLKRIYDFKEFEPSFSDTIDIPPSVGNIDVVWKKQFRIDAAFEVENSTAIYSGLLRFADLTTVAPNTTYPLFIVAPAARRSRVRDQIWRPAFGRLELSEKVKFLTYETVDEIQKFFAKTSGGVTVEMMLAKAESLTPP